ncbi:STAS domain-containing protein [Nonomuraea lactucae]|uniref:STAS domain-containing protein n=1 Tax=Nonomuraea lactucae TaxID=2249762 RepID=UPI0013B38D0F|nr:STAS domain-containing protein [Nonomuraea lactucae]
MSWLTYASQHLPGVTVIAVGGELDATNAGRLESYVADARQGPGDHLVFDLTEVRFMDSAGLRALLNSCLAVARHGGSARLAALQTMPARIVRITRVEAHLPVHETVDDALTAALSPPKPPRRPAQGSGGTSAA